MATHPSNIAPDESQSHTRASQHHIAGLGELLRSARARQGLALQQVCNETKIPRRYLEALEQDRLEALPGGLYRRAHVRAYAQALQLDPGLVLAQLERDLKALVPVTAVPEPPRKPEAAVLTRTRVLIRIGLVGAVAYVEQALRKQALYLNTLARNFIQTGSAKISTIPNRLRRRSHN
jgi:cytoskeletal protein RodZ